jgi:hypothetical protein
MVAVVVEVLHLLMELKVMVVVVMEFIGTLGVFQVLRLVVVAVVEHPMGLGHHVAIFKVELITLG